MHSTKLYSAVGVLVCGLLFLATPRLSFAASTPGQCQQWVAKVHSVQGKVQLRNPDAQANPKWLAVKLNDRFCKGDILRVLQNSRAALALKNDTLLRLSPNTTITFTDLSADQPSKVDVAEGIAHFISRVRAAFEVITPFMNAAIEGTEFVVAVDKANTQTEVTVFEGVVRAYNEQGEVKLTENQTAQAKQGQAPLLILKAQPRDAVSWSLYYPVIYTPANTSNNTVNESYAAYQAGQVTTALAKVQGVQDPDAALLGYRASLYLSVGQIELAEKDLAQALKQNPNNSAVLAMQAVIKIVQNNKAAGLTLAQQAVTADKQSATAKLALSYAYQAQFNIDAALQVLQEASKSSGVGDALIWSRLAEVYLMQGQLDAALAAAQQANKLNPDLGRTHMVLGFAYLTRIDIAQAIASFNTAIEKDQVDPLARLGLGLATIRKGDLANGRREIEYAATLDPNNALIRSYLGKAYYEEKRNKLAATQFEMAKALDPNDPTAYFYDAIRKQSENMPGEALQEIQKATELNQKRAVYRSQLLLDKDAAVRNSNTARIYSELGFEQSALLEASDALQKDYGNYSAHRSLADSYSKKDRHEIARVSEVYQSILFSPLNTTPIPPHIGETDLGTVNNAGPTDASLNEYDPLFARNGTNWRISAIGGNNQTAGDEVIYSAIEGNFALSLGQYHYQTEGFRANNDLKQDIYNMFFQWAVNPKHSVQMEFTDSRKENGDLRLRFDPTNFAENRRETDDKKTARLGYLYKPTSNLDVVASFSLQENDLTRESVSALNATLDVVDGFDDKHNSHNTELQLVHRTEHTQTIIGGSNYVDDFDNKTVLQIKSGATVVVDNSTTVVDKLYHKSAYIYEDITFGTTNILLGVSNDDQNDNVTNLYVNQINPKIGIRQSFFGVNARVAYYRTLKRPLINNQTLEPSNIVGFVQVYDEPQGADSQNYAIAFDYSKTTSLLMGTEFTKRNLLVPLLSNGKQIDEGQNERIGRFFVSWLPTKNFSLNMSYEYLDQERELTNSITLNVPYELTTQKIPLSLKFFSNYGFTYAMTASYFNQEILEYKSVSGQTIKNSDSDSFTIVDAEINYKLPKRAGKISLIINNAFNQDFKYEDTTFRNQLAQQPSIQHDRSISLRATFNF